MTQTYSSYLMVPAAPRKVRIVLPRIRGKLFMALVVVAAALSYLFGRNFGLPVAAGTQPSQAEASSYTASHPPAGQTSLAVPAHRLVADTAITTPPATPLPATAPLAAPVARAVSTVAPTGGYVNMYAFGNCTYYVASRRHVPGLWGNANAWYWSAQQSGWAVGTAPTVGAIAWTGAGALGHVALVEQVSGSTIYISEMNFNGNWNRVTYRWADASSFRYIY